MGAFRQILIQLFFVCLFDLAASLTFLEKLWSQIFAFQAFGRTHLCNQVLWFCGLQLLKVQPLVKYLNGEVCRVKVKPQKSCWENTIKAQSKPNNEASCTCGKRSRILHSTKNRTIQENRSIHLQINILQQPLNFNLDQHGTSIPMTLLDHVMMMGMMLCYVY